jgi:toxin YoeB
MQIKRIQWDIDAWEEYCQWQQTNKAVLKRINALIKDMERSPFEGIGKPEPLKENLSGFWSVSMTNTGLFMRLRKRLW